MDFESLFPLFRPSHIALSIVQRQGIPKRYVSFVNGELGKTDIANIPLLSWIIAIH